MHKELDKMLAAKIIEPIKELDWVSPMAIKEKKTKGELQRFEKVE